MIYLRSTLFNLLWLLWTTGVTLLCALAIPLPPRASTNLGRAWAYGTTLLLRAVCGVRMEIRGRENIPEGACLIACKHQSAWETVVFLHVLHWGLYTPKIELVRLPVFGWCLSHIGHIGVDRKAGARALRDLVEQTRDRLALGRQVVIFPEGRRVAVDTTEKYHPGVAAIYAKADSVVVPAALNSGFFWPRNSFLKKPGTIVLEFLEPIQPGMDRREFLRQVEESIETRSRALLEEARQAEGTGPAVDVSIAGAVREPELAAEDAEAPQRREGMG